MEVHGVLWVIDELHRCKLTTGVTLRSALNLFSSDATVRLPRRELAAYIKRYEGMKWKKPHGNPGNRRIGRQTTGGGNATHAGTDFQNRLTAWVAVRLLQSMKLSPEGTCLRA